jgi:hypothetical protein
MNELDIYIDLWYACSSCHPDIFNALQGYFGIPFCGDWSCNSMVGEDCSSCSVDCGACDLFPQNYIAYWKFDGNVIDQTGTHNGVIVGSPQFVPSGVGGQALELNGASDYVEVPNPFWSFDKLTISAWVKPVPAPSGIDFITRGGGTFSMSFRVRWDQGSFQFLYGDGTSTDNAGAPLNLPKDAWTHLVMTFDSGTWQLYLNKILNATDNELNINSTTQGNFLIGEKWEGQLDDVMIFDRVLNATEVQMIYDAQVGTPTGCINDPGCSGAGDFCSGNIPYACILNTSDGCLDRADGADCSLSGEVCSGGACVPNPCSGISQCSDYANTNDCGADSCGAATTGICTWNSTSGACEESFITYTITTNPGAGGSISPSGPVTVNAGSDFTFDIIPDSGYVTKNIYVSGSRGAAPTYTFYSIGSDYTLRVEFVPQANNISELIYVDNQLPADCVGNYNISSRDCSGSDGDAYTIIGKANNVAGPGDTVLIRGGTYHHGSGYDCDVIWPKHSGTAGNPIIYKSHNNEKVIIGNSPSSPTSYPNDAWCSIGRAPITMRNVAYVKIEDIEFGPTGGWISILDSHNITISGCDFHDAGYNWKGGKIFNSENVRISNCSFKDYNAAGDNLAIILGQKNVVENSVFENSGHALLAIRGSNNNVIRNNVFSDVDENQLVEIYDAKVEKPTQNVFYIVVPRYNNARYNVFEGNTFGHGPCLGVPYPSGNARCKSQALEFSGQYTITRNNVFNNPVTQTYPNAGGVAVSMRWGGSWSGWDDRRGIVGQAHEAGFVHNNKFYHNTFFGYDTGKIMNPVDNAMQGVQNPPPMKWVLDYWNYPYNETYIFEQNIFKNNIFYEGRTVTYINWGIYKNTNGMPVQAYLRGIVDDTFFSGNNFFATGNESDRLIYDAVANIPPYAQPPSFFDASYAAWSNNKQLNPGFVDESNGDFSLHSGSNMIDAAEFLTTAVSGGSGTMMQVADAGYFYDGYDIPGELGDLIRIENGGTARILDIDYSTNILTLDTSLNWVARQGVSLAYSGSAPDIGAFEY